MRKTVLGSLPRLSLLLLVPEETTGYMDQLQGVFEEAGHDVLRVQAVREAEDCLVQTPLDAIICDDSHPSVTFLSDVDALAFDETERPPLCIVTSQPAPPQLDFVDMIMPQVPPPFLLRELLTLVQHRGHITRLRRDHSEVELLKNAIVHNVSHELKTPLLQVKAAVGLIAEDAGDDTLTQMAVRATARLETVVKNITLLADGLKGNVGPVLIQESVDQALRNLRRSWEHRDDIQRIELNVEPQLPPILGDKQGLGIVLQQLMDNGLKFSKEAGTPVVVSICSIEAGVSIAVSDSGIGIAADKLKQIFDTFYQVDSSSTRRYGGTGVGLALVRLILEKHDVEIDVDSELGNGSRFSFVLPRADV